MSRLTSSSYKSSPKNSKKESDFSSWTESVSRCRIPAMTNYRSLLRRCATKNLKTFTSLVKTFKTTSLSDNKRKSRSFRRWNSCSRKPKKLWKDGGRLMLMRGWMMCGWRGSMVSCWRRRRWSGSSLEQSKLGGVIEIQELSWTLSFLHKLRRLKSLKAKLSRTKCEKGKNTTKKYCMNKLRKKVK